MKDKQGPGYEGIRMIQVLMCAHGRGLKIYGRLHGWRYALGVSGSSHILDTQVLGSDKGMRNTLRWLQGYVD